MPGESRRESAPDEPTAGPPRTESHFPPGVSPLDHTADVGLAIRARTLGELFDRAARGMLALIHGAESDGSDEAPERDRVYEGGANGVGVERATERPGRASRGERTIELEADDLSALLALWLRELLYLYEAEDFVYRSADLAGLDAVADRGGAAGGLDDDAGPDDAAAERAARDARDASDDDASSEPGTPRLRLRVRVTGGAAVREPVRELKGVTYHGLAVERTSDADGWFARVIFDV